MATRKHVSVELAAEVTRYRSDIRAAAADTVRFRDDLKAVQQVAAGGHDGLRQLGQLGLVGGAALAAGLFASAKAAISFESSFAGVRKTVDATDEELAEIAGELRSLATDVLPMSVHELNRTAEAAGQLGVAKGDIVAFTKVMADLGVATNLSSDQAATATARFFKILGEGVDDADRLGAAIVHLGNNSATTESEIVDMALRIAAAGHTAGLSAPQILGLAAGLSSVGLEAEAGGTAISRIIIDIAAAVTQGGPQLHKFADLAALTVAEFTTLFEQDAAGALTTVIKGLGRLDQAGEDVFGTLADLGFDQVRVRDALLRSAGAGSLLADSIEMSNDAWEDNNALTEEAERRYATTESKIALAKNQMVDMAISIGNVLLPAIGAAAGVFSDMVSGIEDLPGPTSQLIAVLGSLGAGVLTLGGGLLVLAPRIKTTGDAIRGLQASGGRLGTVLGGVQKVMGPLLLTLAAGSIALAAYSRSKQRAEERTKAFVAALNEEREGVEGATEAVVRKQVVDAGAVEALTKIGLTTLDLNRALKDGSDGFGEFNARVDEATEAGRIDHAEKMKLIRVYDALAEASRAAAKEQEDTDAAQRARDSQQTAEDADRLLHLTVERTAALRSLRAGASDTALKLRAMFDEDARGRFSIENDQTFEQYLATLGELEEQAPITAESLLELIPAQERVAAALRNDLNTSVRDAIDIFSGVPEAIEITVSELMDNVAAQIEQNDRFATAVGTLLDAGATELAEELIAVGPAAVAAAEALAADLDSAFRIEGMLRGRAEHMLDGFVDQMNLDAKQRRWEMEGIATDLVDPFGEGVTRGLELYGGEWRTVIVDEIRAAVEAGKRALQSHNPSRVTRLESGEPSAQGITDGIRDQMQDSRPHLRKMAVGMATDFSGPSHPVAAGHAVAAGPTHVIIESIHKTEDGRTLARNVDQVALDNQTKRFARSVS